MTDTEDAPDEEKIKAAMKRIEDNWKHETAVIVRFVSADGLCQRDMSLREYRNSFGLYDLQNTVRVPFFRNTNFKITNHDQVETTQPHAYRTYRLFDKKTEALIANKFQLVTVFFYREEL